MREERAAERAARRASQQENRARVELRNIRIPYQCQYQANQVLTTSGTRGVLGIMQQWLDASGQRQKAETVNKHMKHQTTNLKTDESYLLDVSPYEYCFLPPGATHAHFMLEGTALINGLL